MQPSIKTKYTTRLHQIRVELKRISGSTLFVSFRVYSINSQDSKCYFCRKTNIALSDGWKGVLTELTEDYLTARERKNMVELAVEVMGVK